ncbi:MAG: DUF2339 domain-containing protein [Deltaproteobacteria bacterium]|jgi:uncharacterized membrane protein|nr:DUF2339 domain-containing protein [Deltaproteobacteria bacterium]
MKFSFSTLIIIIILVLLYISIRSIINFFQNLLNKFDIFQAKLTNLININLTSNDLIDNLVKTNQQILLDLKKQAQDSNGQTLPVEPPILANPEPDLTSSLLPPEPLTPPPDLSQTPSPSPTSFPIPPPSPLLSERVERFLNSKTQRLDIQPAKDPDSVELKADDAMLDSEPQPLAAPLASLDELASPSLATPKTADDDWPDELNDVLDQPQAAAFAQKPADSLDQIVDSAIDKVVDAAQDQNLESSLDRKPADSLDQLLDASIDKAVDAAHHQNLESSLDQKPTDSLDEIVDAAIDKVVDAAQNQNLKSPLDQELNDSIGQELVGFKDQTPPTALDHRPEDSKSSSLTGELATQSLDQDAATDSAALSSLTEKESLTVTLPEADKDPTLKEEPQTAAPLPKTTPSPPSPAQPDHLSDWLGQRLTKAYAWFLKEGNAWVTVGVLFFLIGFSLLFKFAVDRGIINMETRLALAAAVGLTMFIFGWRTRLKENRRVFSLLLQGGGIGLLYLLLLAANKMVDLLPASAAVFGMIFLSVFTVILAIKQNSQPLAVTALLSAYATPIFLYSATNQIQVLLFIHALINLEILAITGLRDWFLCRWIGLIASAGTGLVWGWLTWDPSQLWVVETFIIIFTLNYLAITLVPLAFRSLAKPVNQPSDQPPRQADVIMIVSLAFIYLTFQVSVLSSVPYAVAISCLSLGLIWLLYALIANNPAAKERGYNFKILLALAIIFSNLALPFSLQKVATSAIWALEGVVFIVLASYLDSSSTRNALAHVGAYLQLGALVIYHVGPKFHLGSYQPLYSPAKTIWLTNYSQGWSPLLLSATIIALAAFVSSLWFIKGVVKGINLFEPRVLPSFLTPFNAKALAFIFAIYATIWWVFIAPHFCLSVPPDLLFRGRPLIIPFIAVLSLPSLLALFYRFRVLGGFKAANAILDFKPWAPAGVYALPVVFFVSAFALSELFISFLKLPATDHVFLRLTLGLYDWPSLALNCLAIAGLILLTLLTPGRVSPHPTSTIVKIACLSQALLLMVCYLAYFITINILAYNQSVNGDTGNLAFILPLLVMTYVLNVSGRLQKFLGQLKPVLAWILLITVICYVFDFLELTSPRPLPPHSLTNLPFLNSVDLAALAYILAFLLTVNLARNPKTRYYSKQFVAPLLILFWLTMATARAALLIFDETVRLTALNATPNFNSFLALTFGVFGLTLILLGKFRGNRWTWLIGACVLTVDAIKLLALDLRFSPTLVRIIAFMILGVLFILIGWFAPLPPRSPKPDNLTEPNATPKNEDEEVTTKKKAYPLKNS